MATLQPRIRAADPGLVFDIAPPPDAGLRERRRIDVTARIGRAALELAEARGFDAITADAIARAAGVSRATLFRHFARKESALFGWRDAWLADFEAMVEGRGDDEPCRDAIRRAFAEIGRRYAAHRDHMRRHNAVVMTSPSLLAHEAAVDRVWEETIVRLVSEDGETSDRGARWFGAALMGVLRATVREWFEHDAETDLVAAGLEAMEWLVDAPERAVRRSRENAR